MPSPVEFHWHRSFHSQELIEHNTLSLQAGGLLIRLIYLMFCIGGPVKNDVAWIARRTNIRDKRTIQKALAELIDNEAIIVSDSGLIHEKTIKEITNNSAARAEAGRKGGRPAKASYGRDEDQFDISSASDGDLMPICPQTQGSQVIENKQNTEKLVPEQKRTEREEYITTAALEAPRVESHPENGTMNGHAIGGGGQDHGPEVQAVIDEHYRLVASIWGEAEMIEARRDHPRNAELAANWLEKARGNMSVIKRAMQEALRKRKASSNNSTPGTLGACGSSIPEFIGRHLSSPGPTTFSGTSAGMPATGKEPVWIEIRAAATRNGWIDEAKEIRRLSDISDDAANEYALSLRGQISVKKHRAAA